MIFFNNNLPLGTIKAKMKQKYRYWIQIAKNRRWNMITRKFQNVFTAVHDASLKQAKNSTLRLLKLSYHTSVVAGKLGILRSVSTRF